MRTHIARLICGFALTAGASFGTGSLPGSMAPAAAQDLPCVLPEPADAPEEVPDLGPLHDLATGAGTTVAVIDTGVTPHPQLSQLVPGADFVTPAAPHPLHDCDGHGTVVAGIIGGADYGVAPDARIVAIRQTSGHFRIDPDDSGSAGSLASLADAIHDALNHQADVINISVVSCVSPSTRVDDAILRDALARAEDAGAVVVAAAGNITDDCPDGSFVYPAHLPTVVAVAARDGDYTLANYSVTTPEDQPAVSAIGMPEAALSPTGEGFAAGIYPRAQAGLEVFAGTSFAAPVISGTAALLQERFPEESPAQLRQRLIRAAEPADGFIDPYQAISSAGPAKVTAPSEHPVQVQHTEALESFAAHRAIWLNVSVGLFVAILLLVIGLRQRSARTVREAD
ncbi:S8 family serine peptidase [Corynebacterium pilosum]|uniref:Serine protease n=2 Tax=Corynebacterium pilosum TaxID=35756 RepID=A0A376CMZ1_9CORY|nr:S8 family serine peptidase [Corynebacterium pilosum]STC69665.1 serine protease [Corynebacterium pilosum]